MGKVTGGIFGPIVNKVGSVIFAVNKGQNVVRSKPASVSQANSEAQLFQRAKMTLMVALYRLTSAAANMGYTATPNPSSPYNAFTSYNIKNGTSGSTSSTVTYDFASLLFANGSLGTTAVTSVAIDSADEGLTFSFSSSTPLSGQASTDKIYVVVHNATQGLWDTQIATETRASGSADVTLAMNVAAADVCHVYIFFYSEDGSKSGVNTYNLVNAS